jgi:hypothetical protein
MINRATRVSLAWFSMFQITNKILHYATCQRTANVVVRQCLKLYACYRLIIVLEE